MYQISRDIEARLANYQGCVVNRQLYDGMKMCVMAYLDDLKREHEILQYLIGWSNSSNRLEWEIKFDPNGQTYAGCISVNGAVSLRSPEPEPQPEPTLMELINDVFN